MDGRPTSLRSMLGNLSKQGGYATSWSASTAWCQRLPELAPPQELDRGTRNHRIRNSSGRLWRLDVREPKVQCDTPIHSTCTRCCAVSLALSCCSIDLSHSIDTEFEKSPTMPSQLHNEQIPCSRPIRREVPLQYLDSIPRSPVLPGIEAL